MSTTRPAPMLNGNGLAKCPRRSAPELNVLIEPNRVFSLAGLRALLGLRKNSLPRAIRKKRLRAHKVCGKWLLLGSDVIEWIAAG